MSKNIYQRINAVMQDMPAFELDGKNVQQKFEFVSIKNIYNTLRKLMFKHGVVSFPSEVIKSEMQVMTTKKWDNYNKREKDSTMYYCEATVAFTFTCEDGSSFPAISEGGASDYSDKAQGQAMTNAHKNCLKMVFMIAEGDPDANSNGLDDTIVSKPIRPVEPSPAQLTGMEAEFKAAKDNDQVSAIMRKYLSMKANQRYITAAKAARARFAQKQASWFHQDTFF